MPLQTTFSETQRAGVPGMINRMVDYNIVTRYIESAGGIGFPLGASQGAAESGCIVGGTVAGFVGISVRDITIINAAAADVYPTKTNVALLTKGEIFANAPTGGVLTGDVVTFNTTTGALGKTADANNLAIPGARWKFAQAAGALAIVQLGIQR